MKIEEFRTKHIERLTQLEVTPRERELKDVVMSKPASLGKQR